MKRTLFFFIATMWLTMAHASKYAYLTFEQTDGTKVSYLLDIDCDCPSVSMTISEGKLIIGLWSVELTNLSKMYFTSTYETTEASGIDDVKSKMGDGRWKMYDMEGREVYTSDQNERRMAKDENLKSGIYIVKGENKTYKTIVK